MSYFQIAGTEIPEPNPFIINEFKVEKAQRLANARLIKDTIATKHRFELTYPTITWADLNTILTAFEGSDEFFTFQYRDRGATQTATVAISELPRRLRFEDSVANNWLYQDVRIILEEQ